MLSLQGGEPPRAPPRARPSVQRICELVSTLETCGVVHTAFLVGGSGSCKNCQHLMHIKVLLWQHTALMIVSSSCDVVTCQLYLKEKCRNSSLEVVKQYCSDIHDRACCFEQCSIRDKC